MGLGSGVAQHGPDGFAMAGDGAPSPDTWLSAPTIWRPRPVPPPQSACRGIGASLPGSTTASMTSPARLSMHSRSTVIALP